MEKRAIFAILLTFFVILLWTVIQSKFFPQAPSKPAPQEVKKEQVTPAEKAAEKKTDIKESKPLKEGKTAAKAKAYSPKGGLY